MTFENKEQNCALCHAYLFQEDDVVYCPVCGAPHHRECYNSIGKCALEEFHGTENQYDLLKRAQEEKEAQAKQAEAAASDKKRTGKDITVVVPVEIGRCVLNKIPVENLLSLIRAGWEA
jgi:uncharacterized Zn finger protein (UPF0148 family)